MTHSVKDIVQARIIHVVDSDPTKVMGKRSVHVNEELIPSLIRFGIAPKIHKAILGKDLEIRESTVNLNGESFGVGVDWNTGKQPTKNSIALSLGHRQIWQEVVETNTSILVLEDDAQLPVDETDTLYTMGCIGDFLGVGDKNNNPTLLYLQSTCPWRQKQKFYPAEALHDLSANLSAIDNRWYDMSGTASYLITPICAEKLLDYFQDTPITQIDQMFISAHHKRVFRYVIPKQYHRNFPLNFTVAFQNATLGD